MSNESVDAKQAKRRREILGATLRLLRRHGAGITTAQIAAEAHCSKETLYSWFDDRDGILLALVDEQAAGMSQALASGFAGADGSFENRLRAYCTLLFDIMTGDAVVAVNRVAMAQACSDDSSLGERILQTWREKVRQPFYDLFQEGNRSEKLAVHSSDEAFDNLVGLLVGDRQRRALLGEAVRPDPAAMKAMAAKAVQRWLILYGI